MPEKLRLDQLLVARGLFSSREQAQRAVMAGEIKIGTRIAVKPSQLLAADAAIAAEEAAKVRREILDINASQRRP